jgi:hypothetical protein
MVKEKASKAGFHTQLKGIHDVFTFEWSSFMENVRQYSPFLYGAITAALTKKCNENSVDPYVQFVNCIAQIVHREGFRFFAMGSMCGGRRFNPHHPSPLSLL